jgi:hypothetical protein
VGSWRTLGWATFGGVLSGCLLAGVVIAGWTSPPEEPVTGDEAVAQFLKAWERSERGTYHVTSTFRREMSTGRELASTLEVVQRPPDHLRFQLGGVTGSVDGHPVVCSSVVDGASAGVPSVTAEVECTLGETTSRPYDEVVDENMAAWDTLLRGRSRLYRVETKGDGCFSLIITRLEYVPPYGNFARFCFDPETGAVVESEVRRNEGTDYVRAVDIDPVVDDRDFALPG